MTSEIQSFRRVLIVADESADWIVAGLRQLDRLALSIDEFASENKETAPVHVVIFWRPDLDQTLRWTPQNDRLARVTFATGFDGQPFDLVLSTRLFLYRHSVRPLIAASASTIELTSLDETRRWENYFRQLDSLPRSRSGAWDYITDGGHIDAIEKRFLAHTGKSQDGLVSRFLNRPISQAVTRLLLRFPTTPNAWTLLIFPIPIVALLVLIRGTFWSFVVGLLLFQLFSVLDGCDGEIARAKFLESERGRRLDDFCDVLSNILLVIGLGIGLSRQSPGGLAGSFFVVEGITTALLIGVNEFYLATRKPVAREGGAAPLGGALYPRHRDVMERSGILRLGEKPAAWLIQLTKRDVAILFFVFLAAAGSPAWILHLLCLVTAVSLALALRAYRRPA